MPNYRRALIPGGTWFFTVNLLERHGNDLLVREIDLLRDTVRRVSSKYPFLIDAWVVLPGHLHCVMTLPSGNSDFSLRWRLIKSGFSRALPRTERRSAARQAAGELGVWQRQYWEHLIRDEVDFQRHVDYVHVNPRKHGTSNGCGIGRIPPSIVMWRPGFIRRIGAEMWRWKWKGGS
jgi:putative transposase